MIADICHIAQGKDFDTVREKALLDSTAAEQLYRKYASPMYLLYFIHTCLGDDTSALITEQAGDWLTAPKSIAAAKAGLSAVLRQAHSLCMQYYTRKPRKKIKAELLKKAQLPFPMTDKLIAVLHLPIDIKSPLVLCFGLDISQQDTAKILSCSEARVAKRLKEAQSKLNMSPQEIRAVLDGVRPPESELSGIFDCLAVDAEEKGYRSKRRLNRWKRNLDRIVPYISLAILLLLLLVFLDVHFGWFTAA